MSPAANQSSLAQPGPGAKAAATDFTPETTEHSLIHWLTQYGDGQKCGRNLAVYLICVAVTYGAMAVATQISPHDPPKLSLLRDWAVGFALWISLPAILFFVASDQDALRRAMTGVETAGIVKSGISS